MVKMMASLALALAAGPVLAGDYLRDSDGDVVSVMPYTGKNPVILRDHQPVYSQRFEVTATDGTKVSVTPPAGAEVVKVGATTYQVERQGATLFLRDTATGVRHKGVRLAGGKSVNPNAFALD